MLREAVRLVADLLEELEAQIVAAELDGAGFPLDVDELFLFGEAHDHRRRDVECVEDVHGGVELAQPAVDQDDIRVELVPRPGLP